MHPMQKRFHKICLRLLRIFLWDCVCTERADPFVCEEGVAYVYAHAIITDGNAKLFHVSGSTPAHPLSFMVRAFEKQHRWVFLRPGAVVS